MNRMPVTQPVALDPDALSKAAAALYPDVGPISRAKAKYRPYICPFHVVLPLVPTGSSVLDIGCGNGLLLGLLAVTGRMREGAGYDLSESAVGQAREMARSITMGAKLTFYVGDSPACVPGGGGDFDVVTMVDVLHHVPPAHQAGFFAAAASRVRPGGLLIYKDMVNFPDWRAYTNVMHDIVLAGQRSRYAPTSAVEQWAESAGLTTRERGRFDMLWYGHQLRVFERPRKG